VKEPRGKEVDDSDSFVFNSDFSARLHKIKIGTVSAAKESEQKRQETRQKVCGCFGVESVLWFFVFVRFNEFFYSFIHSLTHSFTHSHTHSFTHSLIHSLIHSSKPLQVDEDRKHQIEASIVRVMKARRVLNHNSLVAAVVSQLESRFVPNTNFIKQRIESLIEREFIERSKDDRKVYQYLA